MVAVQPKTKNCLLNNRDDAFTSRPRGESSVTGQSVAAANPWQLSGHNKVPQILVGITFPQILALFFISARAYTRVKILHQWSLDDSLIMLAWISSIPISVLFGVATRYGHGHHVDDVPFDVVKKSFSIVYATVICYQVALASTKLSILVFYHRVFPGRREIWM